jgi:hypothetical protein
LRPEDSLAGYSSPRRVGTKKATEPGGSLNAVAAGRRRRFILMIRLANVCPGASRMAGESMNEDDTIRQSALESH